MAKIRINGDTSGYIEISAPNVAGSTSITLPATTGGSLLATDASGNLNVDSGTLYVDGVNNRVGIGTTSVQSRLHVAKSGAEGIEFYPGDSSNVNVTYHYNRSGSAWVSNSQWAASHVFQIQSTEAARIDTSGRLLIGTSSAPTASVPNPSKLVVAGNTANTGSGSITLARGSAVTIADQLAGEIFFTDSAEKYFARIAAECDGTPGTNDYPGRLVFSTTADGASSPTERGRFTSTGYFKASNNGGYTTFGTDMHELRTTAAQWTTSIRNAHASDPYGLYITYSASPNGTVNNFVHCSTDTGGTFAAIRSNGGLANVQANNVNLSDARAKKDITPAADTWGCVKEWEIVNYRYKNQPDDGDLNLGVIAQQVEESCPEVITVFQEATEDEPEKLGVKEQQMYWMAIKALQEAQLRIEQLEATNASFEARLSALEVKP